MKQAFIVLIFISSYLCGFTQGAKEILKGVVVHDVSGQAIIGATVFIAGCNKTITGDSGDFNINITPIYKKKDKFDIFIWHNDYGFMTYEADIDKLPIILMPINKEVGIVGTTYDYDSKKLIEGIKVSVTSNVSTQSKSLQDISNEFGQVEIVIDKSTIKKQFSHLELAFTDPSGRYQDMKKTININAPFEVLLTKKIAKPIKKELKVDGYKEFTLNNVSKGSIVSIKAGGNMEVGVHVGNSGPEGRASGPLGLSITHYNIVKSFNHASLMYKQLGEYRWNYCGEACEFKSKSSGDLTLIFEVNDNTQGDNSGFYNVAVTVKEQ